MAALLDVIELFDADGVAFVPDSIEVAREHRPLPLASVHDELQLGHRQNGSTGTGDQQPLHSVASTEPAIVTLARHWGLIAALVEVTTSKIEPIRKLPLRIRNQGDTAIGEACNAAISGFALRRASDWVVERFGHPSEIYEYLARVCNVACSFCYLHGNPKTIAVARGTSVVDRKEIATRLRYFDPRNGRGLFQAQWEINEFLVDPKIDEVLPRLRDLSSDPFYFITNGNPLSPRTIDLLARVRPVHLIVSINTFDDGLRGHVMREQKHQTSRALSALQSLVDHGITFGISVAAFPDFSLENLTQTIKIAGSLPSAFIRVNLPGYTRYLPYPHGQITNDYWIKVTELVSSLRPEVATPLIIIPSAFEEGRLPDPLSPRIIGTVPGSPAASGGLQPDDLVTQLNGIPIDCRADLHNVLLLTRGVVHLEIRRGRETLNCELHVDRPPQYPYDGSIICKYVFPAGVVAAPCLSPRAASDIEQFANELDARRIWIMTSPIVERAARTLLDRFAPKVAPRITLIVVKNAFLGGNISVLDMATVSDMAQAIERRRTTESLPDLILLADSGFTQQGRDLEGRHWQDLERHFRVPVRLISVNRFAY
jgi:uncharacterized Fe-S cluster-containing radical SAM superfamily protein